MHPLAARLAAALALAIAVALAPATAGDAQAKRLTHAATGFSASAPADFAVHFQRRGGSYVIASRRRGVALTYQRVRTSRSPLAAGELLTRLADTEATSRRAGEDVFRAVLGTDQVLRVRRSGRRTLTVVRFSLEAWSSRRALLTRIRRSIRGGRAASLPAGPSQAPQSPDSGSGGRVLFRGDFESSTFAGWYVQSLRSRARVFAGGAAASGHAARFEVHDGDEEPDTGSERSEISLSGPDFREGQELYFRDMIRIPRGSSIGGSWQIINQLHEHDWGGSPGIAVFLEPGPSIAIGAGDGSPTFLERAALDFDRWHDLVYRVKLSRDPGTGFVEVWLDGVPLELANGRQRIYGQTIQAERAYLKAGIYRGRSHDGTSVVEHDNIVVGTTLAAVAD